MTACLAKESRNFLGVGRNSYIDFLLNREFIRETAEKKQKILEKIMKFFKLKCNQRAQKFEEVLYNRFKKE